jgi:predicted PurR-regulated permease PerM
MDEATKSTRAVPLLVAVASFVVVVAGMRAAEALLAPFLLSVFLAIISAPPLFWLEQKGIPRVLAMLAVIAGIVAILLLMAAIIGSSLDGFTRNLPTYQAHLRETTGTLLTWLKDKGLTIPEAQVAKYLDPGAILKLIANTLNGLGGVLGNVFLIFLTVLFVLFEASSFPVKLRAILGADHASLRDLGKLTANVRRYLAIKTWTSLATGIAVAIWLKFVGVDFAVLWGLLAFLLNYIPNIGSIIAAVPAVLLAFIQLDIGAVVWTGIGYVAINMIIGSVIEPRFMGHRLGLSTLIVFISMVFWGWVLGPVGMFLSVPLTMTLKLAMEQDPRSRWIAVLLGSEGYARGLLPDTLEETTGPLPEKKPPAKDAGPATPR